MDLYLPQNLIFRSNTGIENIFLGGLSISQILKEYNFTINDFEPYLPLPASDLTENKIEQRYLGYYLKWDPQECYYYAAQNTGFRPNTERTEGSYSKYSSIDDKIDPFHYFFTYIKFGIGRATYDACQEIRNDKITREEGIQLIKKFDNEFPKKYFREFLEYVDINENEFWKTVNNFRSPHLWKMINEKWNIKKTIFNEK